MPLYLKCVECRENPPSGSTEYAHFMEAEHEGESVRRAKCTGCGRWRPWWWFPTLQHEVGVKLLTRTR